MDDLSRKPMGKIPATVITGFLGAGKTSLMRHVLETANGRRLGLIINEFGDVGMDRDILAACGIEGCGEDDIIELANGCICCTVADDFLPAMEALSKQGKWQVFIAPPYTPYAPLLEARGVDTRQILLVHPRNREDLLWSTEQALRSTTCSAVFSWLGAGEYRYSELRKLQLAASGSDALAVLFRSNQAAKNHAPASLRLQMREYRNVHILKQRGGNQHLDVALPPAEDVPGHPQLWELPAIPDNRQQGSALGAHALQ